MPVDMMVRRLQEVERLLAKGRISKEQAEKRAASIRKRGHKWKARIELPNGKERLLDAKSEKDALRLEHLAKDRIQQGDFQDPAALKVLAAVVLDFYLETKMAGKASFKNARAHMEYSKVMLKGVTIERLHHKAEELVPAYEAELPKRFPKAFRTPKSIWNHKAYIRAAFNLYIRKKRLRILNPFQIWDMPMPRNTRRQVITEAQHRLVVRTAQGDRDLPDFVWRYLECGWETGWRAGEIQDWAWERVTLDPPADEAPFIRTLVEKQGGGEAVYEDKPISSRVVEVLRGMPVGQREHGRVWRLCRAMHDRYVRRAFEAAGLGHLKFHDYRRSFKLRMEALGLPEKLVMDYQGHKTREMHDRYSVHHRRALEAVIGRRDDFGTNLSDLAKSEDIR